MPSPYDPPVPRRRKIFLAVVAALVVLGAAAGVAAYLLLRQPGNISHPDVHFVAPPATPPVPKPKAVDTFEWPLYGYTKDHNRDFQPARALHKPFRPVWSHRAGALLEFPPVISRGSIFQLGDNAMLVAMNKTTGRVRWRRKVGALSASSPAVDARRVYVTVLVGRAGSGSGRVAAFRVKGGRPVWTRNLPSRAESSPLLLGDRLYFGTENGGVYCVKAATGRVIWTYRAHGAVKGSPTYADGKLYFGDYGGHVQAIRATNGHVVWDSGAATGPLRSGTFYSTAAVAFGRVYIGNTDGREYSFSTQDGKLAWARQTGNYVYSSSAVSDVPGLGPTVFFGSYDGTFYALDARSGAVRWSHNSGGKISGSPTIVGDIVYFSDLGRRATIGLRTKTGANVYEHPAGAFDPITSDGRWLYLTSRSTLTALAPLTGQGTKAQRAAKKKHAKQKAQRKRKKR